MNYLTTKQCADMGNGEKNGNTKHKKDRHWRSMLPLRRVSSIVSGCGDDWGNGNEPVPLYWMQGWYGREGGCYKTIFIKMRIIKFWEFFNIW